MIDGRTTALFFSALLLVPGCALWHARAGGHADAGVGLDAAPPLPDAAASDAGPCPVGEQLFRPGCGGEGIRITPGCYQPCAGPGDATCATGMVCDRTEIDPCSCSGAGCCTACGADQFLCLPWHSTPFDCEGRDYCSCTGACAPLVDLTHGCICPCDAPFQCGGPPCDCDCGGASYLGCDLASRCPTPQLHCEPPQHAELVDGCPACVGP